MDDGSMVLLTPHRGELVHLDKVAVDFCEALRRNDGVVKLTAHFLADKYGISVEQAEHDLMQLVDEVKDHGVAEVIA